MTTRVLHTRADLLRFVAQLSEQRLPCTVTVKDGYSRSLSQNSTVHMWFADVAKHFGDRDYIRVKAECNAQFGVPIRIREPLFAWVWENSLGKLDHEKQVAFFERQYRLEKSGDEDEGEIFYMTSKMSKPQMTEYMNAMSRTYSEMGVQLRWPEDLR